MSYNIPKGDNPKDSDILVIPKPNINFENLAANISLNLFGILATKAINKSIQNYINSSESKDQYQQIENSTTGTRIYAPDALPNNKPSVAGYWNGYLSSITGLPVLSYITFVGTTYTALNGQVITIPTITFEMVLITMKKGRNIEKTEITGRDTGSVKEYIGAKDWNIELRIVIMASQNVSNGMDEFYSNGKYPEENMKQIDFLLNAPIAIKVICPYIQNRVNNGGDTYLVIEDGVEINQVEGEYEAQRLTIPCCTDNPLIIQIAQ